jgi:hypothetical protein
LLFLAAWLLAPLAAEAQVRGPTRSKNPAPSFSLSSLSDTQPAVTAAKRFQGRDRANPSAVKKSWI